MMRNRVIGAALAATISVVLIASTASAEVKTIKDKRGDHSGLDITSVKLNNGKERLVGSIHLAKKSMRSQGKAIVWLRYSKPHVNFALEMSWNKKKRIRPTVIRSQQRRRFSDVTKRCDVRVKRHYNRFRISVDQDRCFRAQAGRLKFSAFTVSKHGNQDYLPNLSKPVRRG